MAEKNLQPFDSFLQNPISKHLGRLWVILEPLLFGLIGIEADVKMVKGQVIGERQSLLTSLFSRVLCNCKTCRP